MTNYLIGLDIGTSSIKGVLLPADRASDGVTGRQPFTYTTRPGGVIEIAAADYLAACCALLRQLAAAIPPDGRLCGVAAASASGNTLLLGPDGAPCTPIFNWQDARTDAAVTDAVLGADFDADAYYRSTGWRLNKKTFPLAHLAWWKTYEPDKLANASAVCMSTEYLTRVLTGGWGITTSAGTPFYLIDQLTGRYHTEVLERYGVAESKLPPVVPVGAMLGRVTAAGSALCGLPAGTPFYAGTFDHPSAARGVGVLKPGQLLLSCGTSWVGFYPLADRQTAVDNRMLVEPFLSESGGAWAGMVSLASVAARIDETIRAYVDDSAERYHIFQAESRRSSPGAGGLVIAMDGTDDPAVIRSAPRPDVARAIMECVVRMLKKDFDRLALGGVTADSAVMVGGPSESPFWTEVIGYMTGLKVEIRHGAFAGARGAAMVAGIGAGLWKDEEAARSVIG